MRSKIHRTKPRGFTLIEMIVVVAIVGVLAAAAHPLIALQLKRQKELELRQNLRTLRGAIDAYRKAAVDGKISPPDNESRYPRSLQILVDGAPDAASPEQRKVYFLRRLPRDPFAEPTLPAAETWGLRCYDSPPDSPRAGRDVFDVFSRSDETALDGSRYGDW